MTIVLKPETHRAILEKLKSDRYSTADEVVQAALQLLEERDRLLDQPQTLTSIEEFDAMLKQLTDTFTACVKPDVPLLSDEAVSRAGIYQEHP
ncbi:type II toxin-antitoxin system ParD family antitoxin [Roseofilum sp. BLCC_M91]|uniref:Type II toxin-antitoxin system ParD family antitoxin n=1 Tax=Roseofilum halophilum BLCC-M91 TaxID=3022259 RepID=A0ABT7BFH8_9CYAN|nr:type II toxin-antitoxin system ParD family antitoxin [Roseofilum halophilum]MDJ1177349.1 type II toxin-antitoxin system ParD family antitoxin [Roseofilum halophilum BLCC-M91]